MNKLKQLIRPLYAPVLRQYRNRARMQAQQVQIRRRVGECRNLGRPLRVIIGAGSTRYEGWIATDMPAFDILKHEHWALLFQPAFIDNMLAEHVFEHLTTDQFCEFLRIARLYLKPNGRIRIAVPDGYHPDADYIEHVRPGGIGEGATDHKVLYNCDLIPAILQEQGYYCKLLEYFGADGQFHRCEWSAEDGFVGRSASHDGRNAAGTLAYTSLIVDIWLQS